jgi:hypothetical protein
LGFVVDQAALGQVSLSTSVSPAKHFADHCTLIIHSIIRSWYNTSVLASVLVNSVPLNPKRKKENVTYREKWLSDSNVML